MNPSIRTFEMTTKKANRTQSLHPSPVNYRLFVVSVADQDRLHDSTRCIFNIRDNLRDYPPINIFFMEMQQSHTLLPAIKRFYRF